MKQFGSILFASLLLASCATSDTTPPRMKIDQYPTTEKKDTTLNFHGISIVDPYLWLEDDRSDATGAWVKAQNEVTRNYLDKIPFREKIKTRYTELYNYEKVGAPMRAGDYYFIYKNSGLESQGKYFVRKGLDGPEQLFLDINALSPDGTVAASLLGANDENTLMAISISEAGSDWSRIIVYDIATLQPTSDVVRWVKFSGSTWYKNGFYYSRYPEPKKGEELSGNNLNHMVYFHEIGTDQSSDKLIYADPTRPTLYHYTGITEDKKFLILYAAPGTDGYEVYWKDPASEGPFTPLFTDIAFHTSVVESTPDGQLLALTDVNAPKYRLVKVDPANPSPDNWVEVIPQTDDLLQGVSTCGGQLFASFLAKANTRIVRMNYDGSNKKDIQMPDQTGTAGGFAGKKEEMFCFYSFTSFTYPGMIYKYDLATGQNAEFYSPKVKFNPEDYESKQVMYKSKDGTEIPMFIVHKKGIKLDGTNPTLLYGYGGFNVSLTPYFSTSRLILLENGGVFAVANLRGGGEFGEDWHKAGMKDKKQNVFDDFISAAEYLIEEGYTTSAKLGIEGGSNGGLLVGACMTQRPELFHVAFPAVGVLDMLRFHLFTVGKGWIPEYGCADSTAAEFQYLNAYSPYHNLKSGMPYPATMVMTADHDDRVVPAHSFKFAARLQEMYLGENPVVIRIETSAGHGAGMSTDQIIAGETDKWSFFFYNVDTDIK